MPAMVRGTKKRASLKEGGPREIQEKRLLSENPHGGNQTNVRLTGASLSSDPGINPSTDSVTAAFAFLPVRGAFGALHLDPDGLNDLAALSDRSHPTTLGSVVHKDFVFLPLDDLFLGISRITARTRKGDGVAGATGIHHKRQKRKNGKQGKFFHRDSGNGRDPKTRCNQIFSEVKMIKQC